MSSFGFVGNDIYRNQSQQQDTNTNNITTTAAEDPSVNIRKHHLNY
ncbi:MAG: hypothetical protein ACHQ1D_10445 [Nitrososphaerales archaeon]